MQSNNFQPLKTRWPQLYEHAIFAERYVYSDPQTATIKLRCFAETLVGILYRELNLTCDPAYGFFEKINAQLFRDTVEECVIQKLHAIRMLGNKAAHGRTIETVTALSLVKEAFLVGQWFYKTCSAEVCDEYPSYIAPVKPADQLGKLSQIKEKLAEQLAASKEELTRLEASEKAAQAEVLALNQSLDHAKLEAFRNSATQAASTIDFQPENTRRLISIHDNFAEYTLNDGQAELVNRLGIFLSNKAESVFLLKGYAGTGKTFITKGLTEYFRAIGRNYVLAAPTGKASKVIARKTKSPAFTIHKTIYSFDDIAEYRDDDVDGTETFKFYAKLAVNERSADTVYIVDEASMISDIYQEAEFFRFGSGYLLTDFLKFVNLDHNDHSKKVIFIGDDAQLPPVGMSYSPALNSDYLFREHRLRSAGFELTEVVRQKSESGVIANAIPLRKALKEGVFNKLDVDLSYPDVANVEYQDLMSRYLESCGNKINGESIIIAYSNSDVAEYNHMIRENFFPGNKEVMPGDKVMAVANSNANDIFISNGDFALIRKVVGNPEKRTITLKRKIADSDEVEEIQVPLVFRDVIIGFKDINDVTHNFQAKILEDLLYNKVPALSSDENKALYLDFCIRNNTLPRKSKGFKDALKTDPYFNALRLKYGYAITCHKAQGSEWNHVFVKCRSHQSQLTADYFRWFYTATTRTAQKLYLLDPPRIGIGGGITLVPNPGIGVRPPQNMVAVKPAPVSAPPDVPPTSSAGAPDDLDTFGIPESASFLLEILKEVRNLIDGKGVVINSLTHNQHQEAYNFNRGDEFARINVSYNSRCQIAGVTAPQTTELSAELIIILSPLQRLFVVSVSPEPIQELRFEKPFLNDFHQKVLSLAAESSITVQSVIGRQWCQRYTFTRDREVAVYDVWYNGQSQYTKCQPFVTACSPGVLVHDVEKLLTVGMCA